MTEHLAKPAVLLAVRVPDEFLQRLAARHVVLGLLPPPSMHFLRAIRC